MLKLPPLLERLIEVGKWPRNEDEARPQNLRPLVTIEKIRQIANEESGLYLYPPPFHTEREHSKSNPFLLDPMNAPSEIDFDLAIPIGDFGLGTDTAIILDYRTDRENPRVL